MSFKVRILAMGVLSSPFVLFAQAFSLVLLLTIRDKCNALRRESTCSKSDSIEYWGAQVPQ